MSEVDKPKPYDLCNDDEGHDITVLAQMQTGLYRFYDISDD
jgi:hypothetical protein